MTRVLIVDDHPVFRDGLAGLLATLPEVEVTGTAGTAEEALAAITETAPDVVLMDINLEQDRPPSTWRIANIVSIAFNARSRFGSWYLKV